jgi:hypothetical protein
MVPGERYSQKLRSSDSAKKQVEAAGKLVRAVFCQPDSRSTSHKPDVSLPCERCTVGVEKRAVEKMAKLCTKTIKAGGI